MSAETDTTMSVEKAMSRVLGAESDALAQIAACQSQADETLQSTRKRIRAMARRTQQRLVRLHAACDKRTHELVSRMEEKAATSEETPNRDEGQDTVMEAVRAVAAELTTADSAGAR